MATSFNVNQDDLAFILKQIKIAEAHASGLSMIDAIRTQYAGLTAQDAALTPFGLRTVDGRDNNLLVGQSDLGAADTLFPRLLDPVYVNDQDGDTMPLGPGAPVITNTDYSLPGSVADADPRIISNLVVDQTVDNPAAVEAWFNNPLSLAAFEAAHPGMTPVRPGTVPGSHELVVTNEDLANIPNQSPDIGLSPSFNAWMTFFGQFFDHGLDLVTKGNNGTVFIPLQADDPLIAGKDGQFGTADDLPPELRFMALTRATPVAQVNGDPQHQNTTTSFVDQNQTYTSHASHQVFLREYVKDPGGHAVSTGRLLDGSAAHGSVAGAIGNWAEVKAQALEMLGIRLDDFDVNNVPLLATDQYGKFIPGANGYAQLVMAPDADHATTWLKEGTAAGITTEGSISTGHAFLNDIAHHAAPSVVDHDHDPGTAAIRQVADADIDRDGDGLYTSADLDRDDDGVVTDAEIASLVADVNGDGVVNLADVDRDHSGTLTDADFDIDGNGVVNAADRVADDRNSLTYDNEMLDAHFVTGDGRGNENIALTAVHSIFHSEHNRLVEANKQTILASGDLAFINEWLSVDIDALPASQAAIDALQWDGDRLFQAARFTTEMQYQHLVFEEFARRIQPNVDPFVFTNSADIDPSILAEFAHTVYRFGHSMLTDTVDRLQNDLTTVNGDASQSSLLDAFLNPQMYLATGADLSTINGALVRGLTRDIGNEIDEFVVQDLRSNLLGLPLDLAALNIARGRDAGIPSLNESRAQLYHDFNNVDLKPYTSWTDFAQHLKNPLSLVNFIAAYGTHATITGATTVADKRAAAMELVLGIDENGDGVVTADRIAFLNATGAYAGGSLGGLNDVDLWIGGLAEELNEFGGMLGSTFNFIFEYQMEHLQNGDRFYYLSRTQGLNMLNNLEPNSFADLVMRNTDLGGIYSTHLSGELFSTPDHILELDRGIAQDGPDPTWDNPLQQVLDPKVVRDYADATTITVDGVQHDVGGTLRVSGGEHYVLGGTEGNDRLYGDKGIDTLWGDGGDDYLNAGMESDNVFGGEGDDIIEDPFGDDVLRGNQGNDVISAGTGLDLLFGDAGDDFIVGTTDAKEVFAGQGDDFILGGSAPDTLMGGEGDDWIEGGEGFDGLAGENSQLFFNSTIIGHDILNGQGNDTDYDGESGDDIMVQGAGIQRNNGMLGFDWAIHKGDPNAANSDLGIPIFATQPDLILRDRFDQVEGLSGWKFSDVLIGSDVPAGAAGGAVGTIIDPPASRNFLTQDGVDRIDGLRELLGVAQGVPNAVVFDPDTGGNILLGGAGSDRIEGKGGDDVIDGDAWLNVRIAVHQNRDGSGPVIRSVDSLNAIKADLQSGLIDPGQLQIVREVITTGVAANDVDTAIFSGNLANYTISAPDAGGRRTVTANVGNDGVDTIRNVERLQFADQTIILSGANAPATGTVVISDTTPTEQQLLTATVDVEDLNGIVPGTLAIKWQAFDGTNWIDIPGALGATFRPGDAQDNQRLRAVASFTDGLGSPEAVVSAATAPVIPVNAAPTAILIPALSVAENALNTTAIGVATGVDPDTAVLTYALTDNAGGRFAINATTGAITVADRLLLDYEQATSHAITVAVDDGTTTISRSVTVSLVDAAPESVTGDGRANIILAAAGNDVLDGAGGADTLAAGIGNDRYYVDSLGDVVHEAAGGGTDTVLASASFSLGAGEAIEILRANAGATGLSLTGNELVNRLMSGAGNDTLAGLGGNDRYDVNNAGDVVHEAAGGGTDSVFASVSYALGTGEAVEVLQANAGATGLSLTGNDLANHLISGAGNDTFAGLGGNDRYDVNNAGDVVHEAAGQGSDTVFASTSYTLGAGEAIEILRANAGATGLSLTGNAVANSVVGGNGDDHLDGGGGNDSLNGLLGNDTFVFTAGFGKDRITGFDAAPSGGQDLIDLSGLGVSAANFASLVSIAQVGANTVVTLGADTITLLGVSSASVDHTDFLLSA